MTRPLIAVTGPCKKLKVGWWATKFILWLCGARACYLTAETPALAKAADAVVIGGGDDIEPEHYGESGDAGAHYDPARDALEMAVIKAAVQADVPILGICRGAQLINIVFGGGLYQDIRPLRDKTPNRNSAFVVKTATIEAGSKLQQILMASSVPINSLHSQAIKKIGQPLKIVARDADGFVQGFEHPDKEFLVGVQWHPEYLPYHSRQRSLFKKMISVTRGQNNQLLPQTLLDYLEV